jgi:hypothetical protein
MTQATRVYSTPPTNTPVDPTRRRFLAVAAVASVVSAGTLAAAAAMDPNVPAAVTTPSRPDPAPDPIYAAIERHKEAAVVWNAAVDVRADFPEGRAPLTDEEREQCDVLDDAVAAARDTLEQTGVDLINTAPTTLAGIARALNYIREQMLQEDGIYMPSGLRLADDTDGEYPVAWIEAFLDTIEHAARELDRAGKAVQS